MSVLPSRRRQMDVWDWLLLVAMVGAVWATEAYLVMLLVGAIHLEVWSDLPPFGFVQMILIQFGLFLVSAWIRHARA